MNRCWARTGVPLALTALLFLSGCPAVKTGGGQDGGTGCTVNGDTTAEKATLTEIAKAMIAFHTDTGGWPYGESAWYAVTPTWRMTQPPDTQIDGRPFGPYDTALFAPPPDIPACDSTHTGGYANPCWKGPYLTGASTDSLGTSPWLDQWCNARMYAYIRPNDGNGGGIDLPNALNGLIFIWSTGKEGHDGFTCTDGSCALNINQESQGLPSEAGSDDIIVEVATSAE